MSLHIMAKSVFLWKLTTCLKTSMSRDAADGSTDSTTGAVYLPV